MREAHIPPEVRLPPGLSPYGCRGYQPGHRGERILTLVWQIDLANTKEMLEDQEERLERRRKANSNKNEELQKKEADLEAVRVGPGSRLGANDAFPKTFMLFYLCSGLIEDLNAFQSSRWFEVIEPHQVFLAKMGGTHPNCSCGLLEMRVGLMEICYLVDTLRLRGMFLRRADTISWGLLI